MKRPQQNQCAQGFSKIELLVVILALVGLFLILAPLCGRPTNAGAVCSKRISHLTAAWYLHAADNPGAIATSGYHASIDGQRKTDWVFGSQTTKQLGSESSWSRDDFGFHAEAGDLFSHTTGLPIERMKDETTYDATVTNLYREYRCTAKGKDTKLKKALRVNYSLNAKLDQANGTLAAIPNPETTLLFVEEVATNMTDAAFTTNDVMPKTHRGKVSVSFIDGHVERWHPEKFPQQQP